MKKMKQIMKDEEGLRLVELLAVVVIMAIIAGIAAVSISKVIQRSREDAQVSNVQQMLASANLYDIQEEKGMINGIDLSKLHETGNIKSVDFADKPEAITFEKDEKGVISVKVGAEALSAGKEKNVEKTFSEENSGSIKREDLFPKSDTPKS
jgi:type IV pilus assembly protein PilA